MSLSEDCDENMNREKIQTFDNGINEQNYADSVIARDEMKHRESNDPESESDTSEEEEDGSEYETDIGEEMTGIKDDFDPSGRTIYLQKCEELGIVPVSHFLNVLTSARCDLKHHSLGPKGAQAVARALIQNNYITQLLMCDNAVHSEGTIHVGKLLGENFNISEVDLSQNDVGSIGAQVISRVLRENSALRVLYLAGNSLKDKDASVLAEALKHNSTLHHLDISRNKFSEEAGLKFGPAIDANTGLKTLDLSWNHLRGKGAVAIAKGLAGNFSLRTLLLAWNGFGDTGACAVSEALKENTSLEELDLSNNRISVKGCFDLAGALKVNSTLKILRIGKNAFGSKGAHALLTAIKGNQETAIEVLDLEGVMIDRDSQTMLKDVLNVKPDFDITCEFSKSGGQLGQDLEDAYNRRHRQDKLDADYIIGVLKKYVKSRNLRLIDLFNQFDKDKSMSVSREELVRGFRSIKVPLSDRQLDCFIQEMDKDGDGEIDYSEFTWINDAD